MWVEYGVIHKLKTQKAFHDHTPERNDNDVKMFFTISEFGFLMPEEVFDKNKEILKYLIFKKADPKEL